MRSPASFPARMVAPVLYRSVITLFLLASGSLLNAADRVDFNRDIRPILSENCLSCHGPDSQKRHAGLRLDTNDQTMWKGESGEIAIVPGSPDKSEVIRRITTTDAATVMPPPESGKKLTPKQIETLQQWISEGPSTRGTGRSSLR
ncbi:MAG: c-type cytochrome domain-containing protein [Planctomycetaceae bacterium]